MKVRVPKSFLNLPQKEKDIINRVLEEEVIKTINHEEALLQKIWIKLACIILNKTFGLGKKRLILFLANWDNMYRMNKKIPNEEEREKYLKSEMKRIFKDDDFIDEYLDKLENL